MTDPTPFGDGLPLLALPNGRYAEIERPNPTRIMGWTCPVCGGSSIRWGTERRRWGWRPWRRRVHTDCRTTHRPKRTLELEDPAESNADPVLHAALGAPGANLLAIGPRPPQHPRP